MNAEDPHRTESCQNESPPRMNAEDPHRTELCQDESHPPETKPAGLTRHQKIIFCLIAASYIFNLMSFSILAPFFPIEAKKKGVTSTQIGFIFAVFNLVNFVASPIFGKYLPVLGAKYLFLSGEFVAAGCSILYGILGLIDDTQTFLVFCYVIRSVEALGVSASTTASMTITANTFPDNMAQMVGLLESFAGLGFMFGPPLGGLLYSIGGYGMPFYVLGGVSIATVICNYFLLPSVGVDRTEPGSVKNMLMIPSFYPVAFGVVVGASCLGFIDPTLALHLSTYDLSPSLVAVAFLLIGGVYALTSPLWGYIADKKKVTRIMMVLGFYIATICYLLIGPSPLLKLPHALWLVILSLAMTGLSISAAMMPAFLDLFLSAKWYGFPDDLATQAVVSGLFNSCYSLGGFLGPLLGGYLTDNYSFEWSSTIFAGMNLSVVLVLCIFGLWEWGCGYRRRPPWIRFDEPRAENGETEPLLRNNVNTTQTEAAKA